MEWLAALYGTVFGITVTLAIVELVREWSKPKPSKSAEHRAYLRELARREGRYTEIDNG